MTIASTVVVCACACGCGHEVGGRGKSVGGKLYRKACGYRVVREGGSPPSRIKQDVGTFFAAGTRVLWVFHAGSSTQRTFSAVVLGQENERVTIEAVMDGRTIRRVVNTDALRFDREAR